MSAMASQITSLTIVYSTVYSDADQRKHQSSASLAFVRGIHRWPMNCPHKWPVTRKMFPFDDVVMMASTSYGGKLSIKVHLQWLCMSDGSFVLSAWENYPQAPILGTILLLLCITRLLIFLILHVLTFHFDDICTPKTHEIIGSHTHYV